MSFPIPAEGLQDELVKLIPLDVSHFDALFLVASDPLIWEQHPLKNRYQKEEFQIYFNSAIAEVSSFLVLDRLTHEVIGCTRYYDYHEDQKRVEIGYTFLARSHWGGKYNSAMKMLMINYAFQIVETIYFVIGIHNMRSQKAVEKIGGKLLVSPALHDTKNGEKVVYQLKHEEWNNH